MKLPFHRYRASRRLQKIVDANVKSPELSLEYKRRGDASRKGWARRQAETGSHASHRAAFGVDGPSGFDPARGSVA